MARFHIGDLVVLKSGSMRMCVEGVDEGADTVSTVWCNEGVIGRDAFPAILLNKWEYREENRPPRAAPGKGAYGKGGPDRGDRRGGKGDYRGGDDETRGREKPRRQGWDGKPRDKKYFRNED